MQETRTGNGIVTAPCYRCGKEKIATINEAINPNLDVSLLEMVKMGWGKHRGAFRCNDCKANYQGAKEESYKDGGVWWIFYTDENGDQIAEAGNGQYKDQARTQAHANLHTRRYD